MSKGGLSVEGIMIIVEALFVGAAVVFSEMVLGFNSLSVQLFVSQESNKLLCNSLFSDFFIDYGLVDESLSSSPRFVRLKELFPSTDKALLLDGFKKFNTGGYNLLVGENLKLGESSGKLVSLCDFQVFTPDDKGGFRSVSVVLTKK